MKNEIYSSKTGCPENLPWFLGPGSMGLAHSIAVRESVSQRTPGFMPGNLGRSHLISQIEV